MTACLLSKMNPNSQRGLTFLFVGMLIGASIIVIALPQVMRFTCIFLLFGENALLFGLAFVGAVVYGWRAVNSPHSFDRYVGTPICGALIGVMIVFFSSYFFC